MAATPKTPAGESGWWLAGIVEKHGISVVLNVVLLFFVYMGGSYVLERVFGDDGIATAWVIAQIAATEKNHALIQQLATMLEAAVADDDRNELIVSERITELLTSQERLEAKVDGLIEAADGQ